MGAIAYKAQDNSHWAAYIEQTPAGFVFRHCVNNYIPSSHTDSVLNYWGQDGHKWTAKIDPSGTKFEHWLTGTDNGRHESDHVIYVDWNDDIQKATLEPTHLERMSLIQGLVVRVAIAIVGRAAAHLANPPHAGDGADQKPKPVPNPTDDENGDCGCDDEGV